MDAVRQAQRLYHSGQFSIEEIAEKMDVLLEQAVKHIRYNTHFVGVNDLIPGSYDSDPFERLIPGNLSVSAEQVVYRKVCIEPLQELFDALPKKDRDILGKAYGVFGYPEATLKELGMMLSAPVGKSGVNHRLRKLSDIAEKLRDNEEEKYYD